MKIFILADDLSDGGPLWINALMPMLKVFSECFDVTLLQVPRAGRPLPLPLARLHKWRVMRSHRESWTNDVRSQLDPNGPNLLMVWGSGIHWAHALAPVWDLFSHRILHVLDTQEPEHVKLDLLTRFDLVTCFCNDLAESYAARADRPTLFFPAHVDTLDFHSSKPYRPLDMLIVGRREDRYHLPLFSYFNAPDQERVFIDFVSRGQSPMTREQEFRLLMSAYGKAAAAFCYEPSGVPRFRGRSPLLERWVHAWTSGCTVFGTSPRGGGTTELQDWPESTIELPSEPQEAVELVNLVLSDEEGMSRRRKRNVLEAVRRHDTRLRIEQLLLTLGLPKPEKLQSGLERVSALENELASMV